MAAVLLASASASIVTLSSPANKALKTITTLPFISTKTPSLSSRKSPSTSGASRHLPFPRVAAPPATPTSDENQEEEEEDVDEHGEESSSSSKFSWRDHWYSVSLIEDFDPRFQPHFSFWVEISCSGSTGLPSMGCFPRQMPHRLAPLSEGRIDEGGNLQCSYHGWSFDGRGSCVRLPQASPEGPEARALQSPRACATRLPTMQSQGLLFVWPNENGLERACATKPRRLPDDFDKPEFSSVTIQRDLFYGYDTLMENVFDPSHIDFAHHKVTGRRDRAKPLPFKLDSSGHWGFAGANDGNPQITAEFVAPCYYINKSSREPVIDPSKPLPPQATFRGPYINTGSRDVGPDHRTYPKK